MTRPARTRRAFLRVLAAGTAAAMARSAAAAAEEPAGSAVTPPERQRRARAGEAGARPALPEEIEKQKKSMADSVERLRAFVLPPGIPPACVFRPLASARPRRRRG